MSVLVHAVFILGCAESETPAPPTPEPRVAKTRTKTKAKTRGSRIDSPAPGASVREPWVPVVARTAQPYTDGAVRITLDGRTRDDPGAVLRKRKGRGELIATLITTDLEPGEHTLSLHFSAPGQPDETLTSTFRYDRPAHKVDLLVSDGTGATGARIAVFDADGAYALAGPNAGSADPNDRDARLASVFAPTGHATLWLDPGDYTFVAVRGPRHHIGVHEVSLRDDTRIELAVPRVVPTPGQVLADLHIHTATSKDAFIPDRPRWWSLQSTDLDLVVLSDHNKVTSAPRGGISPPLTVIPGVEQRVGGGAPYGHYNAFPVQAVDDMPPTAPADLGVHWTRWREHHERVPYPGAPAVILQLNHPRGLHFKPEEPPQRGADSASFNRFGYDNTQPVGQGSNAWMHATVGGGLDALAFDVLEVYNRFSWPLYLETRLDWFALMNQGYTFTGTGNSDSHALAVELAGFPANLVEVDDPRDIDGFVRALQDGRVTVTSGPIIELTATAGGRVGRPGDHLTGSRVAVKAKVRAAPWVPVHEIRLVVDGKTVATEQLEAPDGGGSVDRGELVWEGELEADAWLLAEAGWPISDPGWPTPEVGGWYGKLLPGYVPMGFTNPIRVDVDGDGWTQVEPPAG